MSRGAAWAPMVVAASAAVLSGCYSMAPAYERPVAPVAANFPVGALPAKGTAAIDSAADLAWTQFFADARLKRLIELALANNRDLRIAVRNIEQARALVDARRADQLPTWNAGLSEARATKTGGGIGSSYSAGVLVTAYEADLFGRMRSLSEAAAAQSLATDEARKAVQISLVANVANTHLALLGDDQLLGITQQTLASREDSLRLTRLKFDHGATSLLDLRQSDINSCADARGLRTLALPFGVPTETKHTACSSAASARACAKRGVRTACPLVSMAPKPRPCAASSRFINAAPSVSVRSVAGTSGSSAPRRSTASSSVGAR